MGYLITAGEVHRHSLTDFVMWAEDKGIIKRLIPDGWMDALVKYEKEKRMHIQYEELTILGVLNCAIEVEDQLDWIIEHIIEKEDFVVNKLNDEIFLLGNLTEYGPFKSIREAAKVVSKVIVVEKEIVEDLNLDDEEIEI